MTPWENMCVFFFMWSCWENILYEYADSVVLFLHLTAGSSIVALWTSYVWRKQDDSVKKTYDANNPFVFFYNVISIVTQSRKVGHHKNSTRTWKYKLKINLTSRADIRRHFKNLPERCEIKVEKIESCEVHYLVSDFILFGDLPLKSNYVYFCSSAICHRPAFVQRWSTSHHILYILKKQNKKTWIMKQSRILTQNAPLN